LESIAAPLVALEDPEILELTGSEPLTLEEENFCAVHRQSSSKMNPERVEIKRMKQTVVTAMTAGVRNAADLARFRGASSFVVIRWQQNGFIISETF